MKKGFTLVELLAIIFILGIITIVSVPSIISTNNKSKQKEIDTFNETIQNAAEVYIETHLDNEVIKNLKNKTAYTSSASPLILCIKDLISVGALNGGLENPAVTSANLTEYCQINVLSSCKQVINEERAGVKVYWNSNEIKYEFAKNINVCNN